MAREDETKGQIRIAAGVIIVTMLVWMAGSWLGGQYGLEARFAILLDLGAMAAFFWALVVLFLAWRKRQDN